jgi:hypothetical protein
MPQIVASNKVSVFLFEEKTAALAELVNNYSAPPII